MTPLGDEISFHFHDEAASDEAEQIQEKIGSSRSWFANGVVGLCVAGLVALLISGGSEPEAAPSETAPAVPSTTAPEITAPEITAPDSGDPTVTGQLVNGEAFSVSEPNPGVLCATIDETETCHLELVTASGAGMVENALVFGYLPAGAASASIRYRSGPTSNAGVQLEPTARFFAVPLQSSDAYRLQYRDGDFEIEREEPLVAVRGGPSQTPEAAARDGVPDDIAAIGFDQRIAIAAEWTALPEGPVAWSTHPTLLATQPGWGELVLLDPSGTRIERSTPIPGVRLTAQLTQPEALFYLGQQLVGTRELSPASTETALPIVLIRIDRSTGDHLVRLFSQPSTNDEPDIQPIIGRAGWDVGPQLDPIDPTRIGAISGSIQLALADGSSMRLDASSLLPIA